MIMGLMYVFQCTVHNALGLIKFYFKHTDGYTFIFP